MRSRIVQAVQPLPPERGGETLHSLVADVLRHARETCGDADRPGIMLDIESDGIRCVLLRTQRNERETPSLSPREQEIARMVARGFPNKTIAAVLEISAWTVGTYRPTAAAKLGVTSRGWLTCATR